MTSSPKDGLRGFRDQLASIGDLLATFSLPEPPVLDLHAPTAADRVASSEIRGLSKYANSVEKEMAWIDKILEAPLPEGKTLPISNAPHLLALWQTLCSAPYPVLAVNASVPRVPIPPVSAVPGKKGKMLVNGGRPVPDVKIHVVSGGGPGGLPLWIRVIALTNVRLLFEFVEEDSYANSDYSSASSSAASSSSASKIPGANPLHLTTSIHRTVHHLLQAAALQSPVPRIQIQLPRLRPGQDGDEEDGRVERTIEEIRTLGVDIVLATDPVPSPTLSSLSNRPASLALVPSAKINLDLSLLIALSSAILHSPLPPSGNPEGIYKLLIRAFNKDGTPRPVASPGSELESARSSENWRALTLQLGHECKAPLVEEIELVLQEAGLEDTVEFWTTAEAKERLRIIVEKLGGEEERTRSRTMFAREEDTAEEARMRAAAFWETSRYKDRLGPVHLALSAIKVVPESDPPRPIKPATSNPTTLSAALAHLSIPSSTTPSTASPSSSSIASTSLPTPGPPFSHMIPVLQTLLSITSPVKAPPSLTPHTLRTLLHGATHQMTTLSANRASFRSLWKLAVDANVCAGDPSLGSYSFSSEGSGSAADGDAQPRTAVAVAWVCEPRSLGESMRIDRTPALDA